MGIGAAIAGGVGALGSVAGGLISGSAAESAANTQAAAENQASQNALAEYAQTNQNLAPYRAAGTNALSTLSSIFGLQSPTAAPAAAGGAPAAAAGGGSALSALPPGYNFNQGSINQGGGDNPAYQTNSTITDANGNVVWTGSPSDTLATGLQYLSTQPQFAGSATAAAAPTLASAAGPAAANPLSAYGMTGLTYQTPANTQAVLNNPQFQPTQAQLAATPGYQFDLAQGLQSTQNSNAAMGLGVSGAALKGAANYATGLANNTLSTQAGIFQNNYQNALNQNQQGQGIFQSNLGNILNSLFNLTNIGQNAAATTGSQGIQAIGNANTALVGGANASAAGTVGAANATSNALGGVGNSVTNSLLLNNYLNNQSANNNLSYGGGGSP